jgi:hypothetical protein
MSSISIEPVTSDLSKTSNCSVRFSDIRNKDDKASMYFGGVRNGYSPSTPSVPPLFYPHIETIETFRATCHQLAMKLLRCFAISFELDPDYFANGTDILQAGVDNRTQRNGAPRRSASSSLLPSAE